MEPSPGAQAGVVGPSQELPGLTGEHLAVTQWTPGSRLLA